MIVLGELYRRPPLLVVEWTVVGCLAVLCHELGHALAFRRFGIESRISFFMLGGLTAPVDVEAAARLRPSRMLLVTAAGPAVGLVIGLAALAIHPVFDGADQFVRVLVFDVVFDNLGWSIFNLLPISSLDGGGIVVNLAGVIFGRRGEAVGTTVSALASVTIAWLAFVNQLAFVGAIAIIFGIVPPALRLLEGRPGATQPAETDD
jgi:stage IV sporulation protein FB